MQLKLLNIFKNLCKFKHCFVNRQLMKINGKLWHICYTNRSKYISEYTVLATIKLYSYIYMITRNILALCEQSAFKPVCIRRCPCFHYCKLNHSDIVERYKVIFIDDVFFFLFFNLWTINVTLGIRVLVSCLHEPHAMMIDWVQCWFFVNKVICFSKSITVTDLIHMLCYLCELLYNPLSPSIEYICIIVLW